MIMMMMMMMMDYLCGMVDRLKTFSLISSRDNWEILTTSNLRHPTSRIWTCAEPEFRLCWIKLWSSDNHCTTAPPHTQLCILNLLNVLSISTKNKLLIILIITFGWCQVLTSFKTVAEVTQGVTRLYWKKLHIKWGARLNKLKVALI